MPIKTFKNRSFDARPDRIDLRDRIYNPPLVNLPQEYPSSDFVRKHFPDYSRIHDLILDQGKEGACTGFGLAAVVNFLFWKDATTYKKNSVHKVSPRMLYHMARIYDEWPGEDYEGSSCRGGMKGWHRHGVCSDQKWAYRDKIGRIRFLKPKEGWQQDAAQRPLGAYYRINKDSIADMQAAIYEVGAIYVSANVHEGWYLDKKSKLPRIKYPSEEIGGHAFAIVGYNSEGFIVQNSWGPDWGYYGFAVLSFEDWVNNGTDAWVATLGAPMQIDTAGRSINRKSLQDTIGGKAEWFWSSDKKKKTYKYRNKAAQPWSEAKAYEHTLVLGNNGIPLNRLLDVANASEAVKDLCLEQPLQWFTDLKNKAEADNKKAKIKLAIYAHGGLNSEEGSLNRIRVMAPYFKANNIYPLFITWRTGFLESIGGILEDFISGGTSSGQVMPSQGMWDSVKQAVRDAINRSIEVAAGNVVVKPVWTQIKQNATASVQDKAGISLLAKHLVDLSKQLPELEIHLVGHSAGSILLGYLLSQLTTKKHSVDSLHLYAPACTLAFAEKHFATAIKKKTLDGKAFYCDILSNERELADSVGPYGKSLLYLVSRALEAKHKMPLLGFDAAWNPASEQEDMWHTSERKIVDSWRQLATQINAPEVHDKKRSKVF
ncbi:MAG: C1 family peptidase, partial [Gammaproteobacteria bacterium]|nr:C1 family peptidase [Gammaproteobacteria bacterium]